MTSLATDTIKPIKHSGADWMAKQDCFKSPSALGVKVADILGQVYLGIYHISDEVTSKKVDWQNGSDVSVTVYGELATFDGEELTWLILCCVEAGVSVQISGAFKGYTKLTFKHGDRTINLEQQSRDLNAEGLTAEKLAVRYATKPPLWEYRSSYNAAHSVSKTFQMDDLVELILLSHLAMVRISLQGRSFGSLQMQFCQRTSRTGPFWGRHPDLAQAQARFAPYVAALEGWECD
jgi:hypothetical protein